MKKMPPGETSAHQQPNKKSCPCISLWCRVKVTSKHLWPILKYGDQREVVKGYPGNYNFHGQVISGNNLSRYVVQYDILPVPVKDVNVRRKRLGVVVQTEEECPFGRARDMEQYVPYATSS